MARASTKSSAASALAIAWALVAGACAAAAPDTILVNGKVFTANAAQPWAQALAITGERITAVGDTASVAALAGDATHRLDLHGRTVVPGLIQPGARLDGVTTETVRALAAGVYPKGYTSIQASSFPPIGTTVAALVEAAPALRVRLFRRPTPGAGGTHRDSRAHFPPQPSPRIDVRGMAFDFTAADLSRLDLVVGWAYGSEDPLSIRCADAAVLEAYLAALERRGSAEVWRRKRPRAQGTLAVSDAVAARLARFGVVVIQEYAGEASLKSLLDAGVRVALAPPPLKTGGLEAVRWATMEVPEAERVTREQAIEMMTSGAAFAEFAEVDKGRLVVGALADLVALMSPDVFTAPVDRLQGISSLLTVIGGHPVYPAGPWPR